MQWWKATPEWKGETAFIIAGGTSVIGQDTEALRGRKVIVINSSYQVAPWADVLFFGDSRWWREHEKPVSRFAGKVVTVAPSARGDHLLRMKKGSPPGLSDDPETVTMRRTSLMAAMNLGMHFGVSRMVLLGADGKPGSKGKTHHHAPHPWPQKLGCWDEQMLDLKTAARSLRQKGIEVLNASPGSAIPFWPVMTLDDALAVL